MDRVKVLVADKNSFVADGICAILKNHQAIEPVGSVVSSDEVMENVKERTPDIVLMDIAMTNGNNTGIIESISRESIGTRVLLMTEQEDKDLIINGFKMGSSGCIPKRASSADLASAILAVQQGGFFLYPSVANIMVNEYMRVLKITEPDPYDRLTPDEIKVLRTWAEGYKNREIARSLKMISSVVARHKARIMSKLDIHNHIDLVRYAIRNHLINL